MNILELLGGIICLICLFMVVFVMGCIDYYSGRCGENPRLPPKNVSEFTENDKNH